MLHIVSPSPRLNLKIKTQSHDPIYGNDFLHTPFGNQANFWHRQFKAFFAVLDPLLTLPPQNQFPNFKVYPFFKCTKYISIQAWHPGKHLAGDK